MPTFALPEFTATVAKAVSGHPEVVRCLDDLHRRQLFVERHDGREPVYRYHSLLRDFLRALAAAAFTQAWRADVASTAARLAEADRQPEYALARFVDAGDWGNCARLIVQQAPERHRQGRWKPLLGWIDAMPAEAVATAPWLLYWGGVCLTWHDPPRAGLRLEAAHAAFRSAGDATGRVLCAAALTRECIRGTDGPRLDRWLGELRTALFTASGQLSPGALLIGFARLVHGTFTRQPAHPELPVWADRALDVLGSSSADADDAVMAASSLMS